MSGGCHVAGGRGWRSGTLRVVVLRDAGTGACSMRGVLARGGGWIGGGRTRDMYQRPRSDAALACAQGGRSARPLLVACMCGCRTLAKMPWSSCDRGCVRHWDRCLATGWVMLGTVVVVAVAV